MYCKYCGKEISENSKFCKFCGKLVDDSEQIQPEVNHKEVKQEKEITVSATITEPIKVDLSRKPSNKKYKSTVANEIIATIKMIGFALLMCIVYCICFTLIHVKDITTASHESDLYESCYDDYSYAGDVSFIYNLNIDKLYLEKVEECAKTTMSFGDFINISKESSNSISYFEAGTELARRMNLSNSKIEELINEAKEDNTERKSIFTDEVITVSWENRYYENMVAEYYNSNYYDSESWDVISYEKGNELAKCINLSENQIDELKNEAQSEIKDAFEFINNYRQDSFRSDLKNHIKYSIFIAICLMILGRYILISIRWVNNNKTK